MFISLQILNETGWLLHSISQYNLIYTALVLFEQSICIDIFLGYTVTDQDIAFLVPDSCWATVRNSNSIIVDFTEDTIKWRVWRYQRGNQNPYIEEEQTTQWPNEKSTKEQTTIYKTLHRKRWERRGVSGVRVTRSLVLYVCFVDRCLSFFCGHCVFCSSSLYGFWLPPFGIFKLFMFLLFLDILAVVLGF